MAIPRTADTDDDGSGTTGTIRDNAWKTGLYNQIDGRWSVSTSTATGVVADASFGEADYVRVSNASPLVLDSIVAPAGPTKDGKPLTIFAIGAADISVLDQSSSVGTAANKIITGTGQSLQMAAGKGRMVLRYDTTTARWRVVSHWQGAALAYTPGWAAASGSAPAIGNGTRVGMYYVRDRHCYFEIILTAGSTTTFGSGGQLQLGLPLPAASTSVGIFDAEYVDSGSAVYAGKGYYANSTTINLYSHASPMAAVTNAAPFSFGNTDLIIVKGEYLLP